MEAAIRSRNLVQLRQLLPSIGSKLGDMLDLAIHISNEPAVRELVGLATEDKLRSGLDAAFSVKPFSK